MHDGNWPVRCPRPTVAEVEGLAVCRRHATVLRKRAERAAAPHVHRAWASTIYPQPDGRTVRFCADCGAPF